jgi:hypothetical protein
MSTIDAIVKSEQEAAAALEAAQKQAETIKTQGQADAARIIAAVQAQKSADQAAALAALDQRMKDVDAQAQRELQAALAARKRVFDQNLLAAVQWLVNRVVKGESPAGSGPTPAQRM